MKNFFKLVFIFLAMVLTFVSQPFDAEFKEFYPEASIKGYARENVVLVSNNFFGGEIYSSSEDNKQNSLGASPQIVALNYNDNYFINNRVQINKSFIHNLSTNKLKVQQIRAP